jgi:uncharacterized membrane protein YtjA (UPF0391 family)
MPGDCRPRFRVFCKKNPYRARLASKAIGARRQVKRSWTRYKKGGANMLYWALVFLVVVIVAGLLGFGAVAFAAAGIAKILFFLFLVLFLVSLIMHVGRRA